MNNYEQIAEKTFRFRQPTYRRDVFKEYPKVRLPIMTPRPDDLQPIPPSEEPLDILIPVGPGSLFENLELRMALRSIERHAKNYRRVVIVGIDPGFLAPSEKLLFVPREEAPGNHESRIAAKLHWALTSGHTSRYVVMWNDDYVMTNDFDLRELPFYHKGDLPTLDRRKSIDRYRRALHVTAKHLSAAGRRTLNYDVHVPMLLNRECFDWLAPWWKRSEETSCGMVVKSVYANHVLSTTGTKIDDCKLKGYDPALHESKLSGRWMFSYGDHALQSGLVKWLKNRYPQPSKFEKE